MATLEFLFAGTRDGRRFVGTVARLAERRRIRNVGEMWRVRGLAASASPALP